MPKISDSKRAARRAQILERASACFASDGFHAASMESIIARTGISAGAIYLYFPSKEALAGAAAEAALAAMGKRVEAALAVPIGKGGDVRAALSRALLLAASDKTDAESRNLALQVWAEAPRNARLKGLVGAHYAALRETIALAIERAEGRAQLFPDAKSLADAAALLALMHGAMAQEAVVEGVAAGLAG